MIAARKLRQIHESGATPVLLVSNYGSGTVSVFPILPDGSLGEMADLVQHKGSGPTPQRQEEPHAHSATFTPDQRFVIVADLGIDALVVYAFDPATGRTEQARLSTTLLSRV